MRPGWLAVGGAGRSDAEQVAGESMRTTRLAKAGGGERAWVLAPGRGCGSLVTLGGFSCVCMWHFHLGQPEGLAWAEWGWTLPGSDQAVAEGTSREGAGNPSAAWFPLQRPGNALASAQEESPQLSCCALWPGLRGQGSGVDASTSQAGGARVVRPPRGHTYKCRSCHPCTVLRLPHSPSL